MSLPLLLAADPAPVTTADPLTGLYILIGSQMVITLIGSVVAFVKWLGSRTVEREDKDKEKLQKEIDELKEDLESVQEKFEEQLKKNERAISDMDRLVLDTRGEVKSIAAIVESIRGSVSNLVENTDKRIEKQAEHYRVEQTKTLTQVNDALEKLEYSLRQDTTRAIHDARLLGKKRT